MTAPNVSTFQVESTQFRLRRHGRVLTLPVLAMVAIGGAFGYFVGSFEEQWINLLAATAAAVLFAVLGVLPVLSWLSNRVVVTNRRVIVRSGLFVHHRSEVALARVREVRSRRGPLQQLFGSGDVELHVGVDSVTRLRDLAHPTLIVEALQLLIERDYARAASETGPFGSPAAMRPAAGSEFFGSATRVLGDDDISNSTSII